METISAERMSARQLIKAAKDKTNSRRDLVWKLIGLVIIGMIPLVLVEILPGILLDTPVPIPAIYLISFVLLFVVSMFTTLFFASINFVIAAPEQEGIRWGLTQVKEQWVSLSVFVLLVQAIVFGSLLLFIIPALIISVYLVPAFWVYLTEGRRGMDIVVRATSLVYGQFWRVVGTMSLLFVYILLAYFVVVSLFVAGVTAGATNLFPMPVLIIIGFIAVAILPFVLSWLFLFVLNYTFLLTQNLQSQHPAQVYEPSQWKKARLYYKVTVVIGALLTVAYYAWMTHLPIHEARFGPIDDSWSSEEDWIIRE